MDLSSKSTSVFLSDPASAIDGTSPDTDLIVNDSNTFRAHATVLAQASEKLRQLVLQSPPAPRAATSSETPAKYVVRIHLDEPQAFGDFIKFLYTRELPTLTASQLLSLAEISVHFDIEALRTIIEQSLSDRLNFATATTDADVDLVLRLLPRISTLFGPDASSAIVRFAASHAFTFFRQPTALHIDVEVLIAILSSPKLRVASRTQWISFLHQLKKLHPNEARLFKLSQDQFYLENVRTDPTGIAASIACFFADGSEKYTEMTKYAISTFLQSTPSVFVGVLTHDAETRESIQNSLPRNLQHRVLYQLTSSTEHIPGWNQTQYKLDIIKFSDENLGFENVFWFDSDTISFEDCRPLMTRFSSQNELDFYFTPDHVMRSESFRSRWTPNWPLNLVPQACMMGFKSRIMETFFAVWAEKWRDWVTPFPFAYLPDPNPSFSGSAFCTEQYALGLALNKNSWFKQVLTFDRRLVIVQNQHKAADGVITVSGGDGSHSSSSSSTGGSNGHWAEEARQEAQRQTYKKNLRVVVVPAEYTMASQYFVEPSDLAERSGVDSGEMVSVSTSLLFGYPTTSSVSLTSLSIPGLKVQPGAVVADMFGGAILHTYNQNYTVVKGWFDEQQQGTK